MWQILNDAEQAMQAGVFSLTSTIGYSITKSLILYGGFLVVTAVFAWLFRNRLAQFGVTETEPRPVTGSFVPRWYKWDWFGLGLLLIVTIGLNLVLEQTLFDNESLHSEEFYNLAALNELPQKSFAIIYPYSIGHLAAVSALRAVGIGLIYYKIFLNVVAILALYACLSALVAKKTYRWLIISGFLAIFFLPWAAPTLHANLLRFLAPVIWVCGLLTVYYRYAGKWRRQMIAYAALWAGLLFFGSADNIVIGAVVYGLFGLWQWQGAGQWRQKFSLIWPPIIGLGVMLIVFKTQYVSLLFSQLKSISVYSGHANAVPYFNLAAVVQSHSVHDLAVNGAYALIFYVPFIIMAGLIAYGAALWAAEKARGFSAPFALVFLLFVSYILNYRQSFANAGPGRVVTASISLLFILLALKKFYPSNRLTAWLSRGGTLFFGVALFVSLYFLHYSLQYLYTTHTVALRQPQIIPCASTIFAAELNWAGFKYCDQELIQELTAVKGAAVGELGYVYDDTFALYYLLGIRPVVLIPAYYMAYTNQAILVAKIQALEVEYMLYSKRPHFFGVPAAYIYDPRFMSVINQYRQANFKLEADFKAFEIYRRQ